MYCVVLCIVAVCILFVSFETGPQGRLDMGPSGHPL